ALSPSFRGARRAKPEPIVPLAYWERWISGSRRARPGMTTELFSQEPPRLDQLQLRDRPVVEICPGLAWRAVGERDRKHLADILRRLGKTFAAGLIHVELSQQRFGLAQTVELAMDDLVRIVGEHQARIVLYHVEPAAAAYFAEEVGVGGQQLGHRVHITAHQGAVDEKKIGGHVFTLSFRGAREASEPGISRFRVHASRAPE